MSMDSQRRWLGFTIVCFVLLLGILVHEGKIDLNQEKTSSENTDEVSSTADNIHPFGEYCLTD